MRNSIMQYRWLFLGILCVTGVPNPSHSEDTNPAGTVPPVTTAPVDATITPTEMTMIPSDDGTVNDSNPTWSRDGRLLALERNDQNKKEINILNSKDFSFVKKVYYQIDEDTQGLSSLIPGIAESISYNAGLSWSTDSKHFAFMSNAGEGNYDLYLGDMADSAISRLTDHKEKDGMPDWNPIRSDLVFVSGRTGGAQLYWMNIPSGSLKQITNDTQTHLYPIWSPMGDKIAYMRGDNENHDIFVLDYSASTTESKPIELTAWSYDDIRPTWSPDGKYIAFYTNFNKDGDTKSWSLAIVKADGSDIKDKSNLQDHVVATQIIPDIERGPAWLSSSQHIVYIKDVKEDYNPVYIVDIVKKSPKKVVTGTKMNHDVSVSKEDRIAFRAQVNQWDRIYVMKIDKSKLGEI